MSYPGFIVPPHTGHGVVFFVFFSFGLVSVFFGKEETDMIVVYVKRFFMQIKYLFLVIKPGSFIFLIYYFCFYVKDNLLSDLH